MKNTDPLMGAKLKSKTHLQNMFFLFFELFFAHLASKFSKRAVMTKKKKNLSKKILKNKFDEYEYKSEDSAYFHHVFANHFFWVYFFKTFSMDSKSA